MIRGFLRDALWMIWGVTDTRAPVGALLVSTPLSTNGFYTRRGPLSPRPSFGFMRTATLVFRMLGSKTLISQVACRSMGGATTSLAIALTLAAWGAGSLLQSLQQVLVPVAKARPPPQVPVVQISPQACHCHCEVATEQPDGFSINGWGTATIILAAEAVVGALAAILLWGLRACRAAVAWGRPHSGALALEDAPGSGRGSGGKRARGGDLSHLAVDVSQL